MKRWIVAGMICWAAVPGRCTQTVDLVERMDVAPAWSGCPVGFALLTHTNRQFVAFYNENRVMTLAQRDLPSGAWRFVELPSKLGWDSHNYIAMATDNDGFLHVSGNMHAVPLIYFRSTRPLDIHAMEPVHRMTGDQERRVTYPRFMKGPNNAFLFTYREGGSGNGSTLWNRYDCATKTWSRLINVPLFDGEGQRNAYPMGPILGPDGFYHMTWVWRDTPACETCHNISYIRSRDLQNWENAAGKPVSLPIRLGADVVVDPIPVKGGLINPCQAIGFDTQGRVIVTYTKYDAAGNTQLMNARLEGGVWRKVQTSDWNYRWDFSGGGSIIGEVSVGSVEVLDGALAQSYSHAKLGGGRWRLDSETLKPAGKIGGRFRFPPEIGRKEHDTPGMSVRHADDWAADPKTRLSCDGFMYRACWESLPANRDRPQPGGVPPPAMLRVYKMKVRQP